MAFNIKKAVLLEQIQKVFPFISSKTSLQIMSNFRLTYEEENFFITATDLDNSIIVRTSVEGKGNFDTTVNAKKLYEIVRELPEGNVNIDVDENVIIINSEHSFACKIAGSDIKSYPTFPKIEEKSVIEIVADSLKGLVEKSSFAAAKDEQRTFLSGIFWQIEKNKMGMVATDGHKLGSSFIYGTFGTDEKIGIIVSPKSLVQLVKILELSREDKLKVSIGEKYILFETPTIKLCSKLIEGPYPDYEKVIPKKNTKRAIIDRVNFVNAVRRVSVLANQTTHLEKFVFNKNSLEISVLNNDIGAEAREIIPIQYQGDTHIIGFNSNYLQEILNLIKETSKIKLEMNTQISACLIFPFFEEEQKKSSEDLFLLMPLRIIENV